MTTMLQLPNLWREWLWFCPSGLAIRQHSDVGHYVILQRKLNWRRFSTDNVSRAILDDEGRGALE